MPTSRSRSPISAAPLGVEDLELLAMSAYLIGRDDEYLRALDRAHHAYLDAGEGVRAARCAFWLGLRLLLRGETGRATGWLARAQRLLEREERDCVEQGYLLLPVAEQHLAAGDCEAAYATAAGAAEIGERFGEADLIACARHLQGRALMQQGQVEEGLALLDEAMVAVTAGELSPIMTGLIYCSVIEAASRCTRWAAPASGPPPWRSGASSNPQMVAFTGTCLVHRAEIMQLHGAWRGRDRGGAARLRAFAKGSTGSRPPRRSTSKRRCTACAASSRRPRRRIEARASWGWEPQPGLALLRMAQGRTDAAAAAIRRVVSATTDRLQRTRLLPAYVEIMLAAGDIQEARSACRELEEIAESFDTDVLGAMAAHARGAVELAEGDAQAALGSLRRAFEVWQQVEAPYVAARVRVLMGLACRALGDDEGAGLELDAARAVFEQLGAAPDLARLDSLATRRTVGHPHGLTPRELQVLRLVAAGKTNKAIAAELFLSERTVDRHVSNIFTKLDVPSRAAATAYAYEHKLL